VPEIIHEKPVQVVAPVDGQAVGELSRAETEDVIGPFIYHFIEFGDYTFRLAGDPYGIVPEVGLQYAVGTRKDTTLHEIDGLIPATDMVFCARTLSDDAPGRLNEFYLL
jgi:hypothetical protein